VQGVFDNFLSSSNTKYSLKRFEQITRHAHGFKKVNCKYWQHSLMTLGTTPLARDRPSGRALARAYILRIC
ncbi:MAG TPA: hypothetical protein VFC84_08850, partial [Desulfosporosinus sp.]|nr:hypothetical protein [Desulfosporosinus sp.]